MGSKLGSQIKGSSSAEVDFLDLCKQNVRDIEDFAYGGNLLNQRQCQDLSIKLLKITQNIREVLLKCGAPSNLFIPALENLYRYLEKAKVLVRKCGEEDWCTAAVFQSQNENAFREILVDVGLCYNDIYEQAKSTNEDSNVLPEDLRQSSLFRPAMDSDVVLDQEGFLKRLKDLVHQPRSVKLLYPFLSDKEASLKQCLARYLLVKLNSATQHSQASTAKQSQASTLDICSEILWRKESEPSGTWGKDSFLGAGSGASGVCSTQWLGIPCAKKVFHHLEDEIIFLKESGILAHLKHPGIVNFFCCGNGPEKGYRFIAMELMEKSLHDLIEEQKDAHFSLPVGIDIIVQIARAMCYLHGGGVAHRDLKPLNVVVNRLTSEHLMDQYYCVKLVDFGMSKTKVEASKSNTMTAPGIGTIMYRAPEVHPDANPGGKGKINWFKADVFSFAMTCAHLLSLKIPFKDMLQRRELYHGLRNGQRPNLPKDCPPGLDALLSACWDTNPNLRPSFIEICTRLETFRHKRLRLSSIRDQNLQEEEMDFSAGLEFIKETIDEHSSIQEPSVHDTDDEVKRIDFDCLELRKKDEELRRAREEKQADDARMAKLNAEFQDVETRYQSQVAHLTTKMAEYKARADTLAEQVSSLERKASERELSERDSREALGKKDEELAEKGEEYDRLQRRAKEDKQGHEARMAKVNAELQDVETRYQSQVAHLTTKMTEYRALAEKLLTRSHPIPPNLEDSVFIVNEAAFACTKAFIIFLKECKALQTHMALRSVPMGADEKYRKYVVEAYICRCLFAGFENNSYIDSSDGLQGSQYLGPAKYEDHKFLLTQDLVETHQRFVQEYEHLQQLGLQDVITILKMREEPAWAFHTFCCRKLVNIMEGVDAFYQEFPPSGDYSKHSLLHQLATNPKYCNNLLKPFVSLAMAAFRLHRLAFQFNPPAQIFRSARGKKFNPTYMRTAVYMDDDGSDEELVVDLMLVPGFRIGATIIKSTVYLVRSLNDQH